VFINYALYFKSVYLIKQDSAVNSQLQNLSTGMLSENFVY